MNVPVIGRVKNAQVLRNPAYNGLAAKFYDPGQPVQVLPDFDCNVALVKMFPGIQSDVLALYRDKRAIVLEAFGPGNIPFAYSNWLEDIEKTVKAGVPVFVTTQNPYGEADMNLYEVGYKAQKAGAVSCEDMTTEAVLAKLMWILGNFPDVDSDGLAEKFKDNLIGEYYGRIQACYADNTASG